MVVYLVHVLGQWSWWCTWYMCWDNGHGGVPGTCVGTMVMVVYLVHVLGQWSWWCTWYMCWDNGHGGVPGTCQLCWDNVLPRSLPTYTCTGMIMEGEGKGGGRGRGLCQCRPRSWGIFASITVGTVRLPKSTTTVTSARPKRGDKIKPSFKHSLQATSAKISRLQQDRSLEEEKEEEEEEQQNAGEVGSEEESSEGSGEEGSDDDDDDDEGKEPKTVLQVCVCVYVCVCVCVCVCVYCVYILVDLPI